MRSVLVLLICGLLVGSWPTKVVADNHFVQGMIVENFVHIKETQTQIALPSGKWEVAAVEEEGNDMGTYFIKAFLIQATGGKVSRGIYFSSPMEISGGGYREAKYCSRVDLHYRKTVESASGGDQDCRYVNHYRITLAGSKAKIKNVLGKFLDSKGIAHPNHLIIRGFRFADLDRFLNVKYFLNPDVEGFDPFHRTTWQDSPWHPANTVSDPKRVAFIKRQIAWVDEFYPTVKAGWEEKLTGTPIASPTPTAATTKETIPSEDVVGRLKKLDALLKENLISKDEYERKRKQILNSL